jgi:hypothetical protein
MFITCNQLCRGRVAGGTLRPLACFEHRAGVAPVLRTAPNDGLAPLSPGGSRAVGVMPPASGRPVLATLRNVPARLAVAYELALPAASARLLDNRVQLGDELASHYDVVRVALSLQPLLDLDDADDRSRPSQFKCALEGCRVRLHALKVIPDRPACAVRRSTARDRAASCLSWRGPACLGRRAGSRRRVWLSSPLV